MSVAVVAVRRCEGERGRWRAGCGAGVGVVERVDSASSGVKLNAKEGKEK